MSRLQTPARVALGTILLLHGLANTVLPLRGIGAPSGGWWSLSMTLLYVVAIAGFVIAGLGVLGVAPLARLTLPAAFAAGIAGLVVLLWRADSDLWMGVLLSASLPVLTALYVGRCTERAERTLFD
ncbi:MAG: hypothetical protein ABL986_13785 [Vicinamibacterales bacterium]